jgi:very-short-patch-repair endonuclease
MAAESGPLGVDERIATVTTAQHGVVTRAQLRRLGLNDSAISQRVARGRLHRIHRGVYAVGHRVLAPHGRWMAAVLAGGPGTVLSHASAAALWGIRYSASAYVDISVRRTGRTRRAGLRIHRPRALPADEVTAEHRIPVTTPARTILDMAAKLTASRLEYLLDQAEIQELTDYPALDALARAHATHPGATSLRGALTRNDAGTNVPKSGLEILFKGLCRTHGLPQPKINHRVLGEEVDFLFEGHALVVETDSWRYHKTRHAFENDRARDALLATAGYRTLRFTDRQLENDPHTVVATVRAQLENAVRTPA